MMGILPSMAPKEKQFDLVHSDTSGSGATVTFLGVNFGKPSPNARLLIPISGTNGTPSISIGSVTVAGNPATIDIQRNNGGNSRNGHAAIASIAHPGVSSGSVVVNWSGSAGGVAVSAMAVIRAMNLVSATPNDTDPDSDTDNQNSETLNVPARGVIIAAAAVINQSTGWTGADLITTVAGAGGDNSSVAWRRGELAANGSYSVSHLLGESPSRYCFASYG